MPPRTLGEPGSDWTLHDVQEAHGHERKRLARRVGIALLTVIVLLGASGLLGVFSRTVRAQAAGWTLVVEYPWIARAGLGVPWTVTVTAPPTGFPDQVTVAVTSDWLDLFVSDGWSPQPTDETTDAEFDYLTLATPAAADTMTLGFGAYVRPSAQLGSGAEVRLIVDGAPLATVHYDTWLLP